MATYSNQSKNTSVFTPQDFSAVLFLTWGEASFTWGEGAGTWANPFFYSNQTKNTSAMTNQTKN